MPIKLPSIRQPATSTDDRGVETFTRVWYLFFQQLSGNTPKTIQAVTLTASPSSQMVPSDGKIVVQGGTVSLIEIGRGGTFIITGVTNGVIPVSEADVVRITYTVAPVVNFLNG